MRYTWYDIFREWVQVAWILQSSPKINTSKVIVTVNYKDIITMLRMAVWKCLATPMSQKIPHHLNCIHHWSLNAYLFFPMKWLHNYINKWLRNHMQQEKCCLIGFDCTRCTRRPIFHFLMRKQKGWNMGHKVVCIFICICNTRGNKIVYIQ